MYQPNFPEFWVEWKAPLVYIILIKILVYVAGAWNEYGLKKKLDARAFFFWRLESLSDRPPLFPRLSPCARPFFLNPYSFQAPATQVMNISDNNYSSRLYYSEAMRARGIIVLVNPTNW